MATAIIIIVLLLTLAHFYLKCSMMTSFSTMLASIFAMIIAFTYYEKLAELFVSRGYGVNWAHFGCFVLAFVLGFALMRALADLLVGANIDLGKQVKVAASIVCGLTTGAIISGSLLVAMGMLPMQGKIFYSRFDPEKPITLSNPKKPFVNVDGFVVGFYKWISAGSLSSGKSFGVLHADFLSQIHLNRLKVGEDVLTISSRKALTLPSGKNKKPVRTMDLADKGKVTVVRMGILAKSIPDGGANNGSGQILFYPAQIRMIAKKSGSLNLKGGGKALWPIGFLDMEGKLVGSDLEKIETPDTKGLKDRTVWLNAIFQLPPGYEGVLLEFKQNAVVQLPPAVQSTPEVEQALNKGDEEENKPSQQ
ncbi:MAG: hypothetical protein LLF76_10115 [Planctomycetaceae bacterium]|nr:hypothetical protein [Planctomycetaceae bacterium]